MEHDGTAPSISLKHPKASSASRQKNPPNRFPQTGRNQASRREFLHQEHRSSGSWSTRPEQQNQHKDIKINQGWKVFPAGLHRTLHLFNLFQFLKTFKCLLKHIETSWCIHGESWWAVNLRHLANRPQLFHAGKHAARYHVISFLRLTRRSPQKVPVSGSGTTSCVPLRPVKAHPAGVKMS